MHRNLIRWSAAAAVTLALPAAASAHTVAHAAKTTPAKSAPARHHHAKHAPGWNLQQPQPGIMRWTTPSGRTYTTHPTRYEE